MTQRSGPWPAGTPCWADLVTSDLGRTQEFYRQVLGWQYDEPGAVAWCDLTTPDHRAARDFYAQVFGYSYEDMGGEGVPYTVFTVPQGKGPAGGIGGTDPSAQPTPAIWAVGFRVDGVDTAVQRVRDAGARSWRTRSTPRTAGSPWWPARTGSPSRSWPRGSRRSARPPARERDGTTM